MKKQLLIGLGIVFMNVAHAQTQKGNGLISGSFSVNYGSYSSSQFTTSKYRNWSPNFDLTVGRFVADNWLIGLSVSGTSQFSTLNSSAIGQTLSTSQKTVSVNTTLLGRRYWRFDPVLVFAGAGVSVNISGLRQSGGDLINGTISDVNRSYNAFSVSPYLEGGLNYFLTNRLALQLSASTSSLPFNVGSLGLGLIYWTGPDRKANVQEERENQQTRRGNWITEGGFSAVTVKQNQSEPVNDEQRTSTYTISPSVGYFIGRNSILGIQLPTVFEKAENRNQNSSISTANNSWQVSISPYYQRYWSSTRLTPFTKVSASYLLAGNDTADKAAKTIAGNVSIGLAYMAGQRFIIETSLASANFAYALSNETTSNSSQCNATLSAGLQGNFAVRYVLTRPR